jgi:hypothetical protein
LEGLGSAAGIELEHVDCGGGGGGDALQEGGDDGIEERCASFTTPGEDTLFVDSLFQVEEEL